MKVILIHGLGRTPLSMLLLRRRLKSNGHTVHLFGYVPTFETMDCVCTRLAKTITQKIGDAPYALIGHSLGTVVIRHAYQHFIHRPVACFFLAPPMAVCKAARFFGRWFVFRWVTREMGRLLGDDAFMDTLPVPVNTTIYAGTGGSTAKWLPFGGEENDVILSVAEATANSKTARVLEVPSTHTFIMNSKVVLMDIAKQLDKSVSSSTGI